MPLKSHAFMENYTVFEDKEPLQTGQTTKSA